MSTITSPTTPRRRPLSRVITCVPISSDLSQRRSLGTLAKGSFVVDDKLNRRPQPEGLQPF